MTQNFSTSVPINSNPASVWEFLTKPELMKEWMGNPEMNVEVITDWKVNSPIFINAFLHTKFESKGFVLKYDKEKTLSYSQLASISQLPEKSENYHILEFILNPFDNQTNLTINITNFPTVAIRKHLEFYWRTTILVIKTAIESKKTIGFPGKITFQNFRI